MVEDVGWGHGGQLQGGAGSRLGGHGHEAVRGHTGGRPRRLGASSKRVNTSQEVEAEFLTAGGEI